MTTEFFETTYGEEIYLLKEPVTVVLDKGWDKVTSDERILLGKILASVKLSLNAVRIISNATPNARDFAPATRVLCFGAAMLPVSESYLVTVVNDLKFIQADALSGLDDVKKKNLWIAMKALFLA